MKTCIGDVGVVKLPVRSSPVCTCVISHACVEIAARISHEPPLSQEPTLLSDRLFGAGIRTSSWRGRELLPIEAAERRPLARLRPSAAKSNLRNGDGIQESLSRMRPFVTSTAHWHPDSQVAILRRYPRPVTALLPADETKVLTKSVLPQCFRD
jgi:hypothetical protein